RLSVRNWRTSRPPVAPSESRIASSVWRVAARLNTRFATFAQAMNRRIPTGPEQHQERQPHVLHRGLEERNNVHAPVTAVGGMRLFNPPGDEGKLCLRLHERDAGC